MNRQAPAGRTNAAVQIAANEYVMKYIPSIIAKAPFEFPYT